MATESTGKELFQWTDSISPTWKGVIIFSLIGITTYATIEIIKGIKNAKNAAASKAEVDQFNSDLSALNSNGITQTYQQSSYDQWADSLAQIMTGKDLEPSLCIAGNLINYSGDGSAIANIMSNLKNDADFLQLQIAFGTRTIDKGWLETNYTNVTLSAAISAQLSTCEIATINGMLVTNGLTKQF